MSTCCFTTASSQFSQWSYWLNVSISSPFNSADILIAPPESSGSFTFSSPIAVVGNSKKPAACRPTTLLGNGSEWICDISVATATIAFLIDSSGAYPPNSIPAIQGVSSFQVNNTSNNPSAPPPLSVACTQADPPSKCPAIQSISHDNTTPSTPPSSSNSGLSPNTIITIAIVVSVSVAAVLIVAFMRLRNTDWFKNTIKGFSNEDVEPPQPVTTPIPFLSIPVHDTGAFTSSNLSSGSSPRPSVGNVDSPSRRNIPTPTVPIPIHSHINQGGGGSVRGRKTPVNPLAFNRRHGIRVHLIQQPNFVRPEISRGRNSSPDSTVQSSAAFEMSSLGVIRKKEIDDDDELPLHAITQKK
ncbi:UNVERIFIED_CONTAM: hypothetical protein HDU68_004563 [Siphonaria sp. JEL0065]|nr:hypothetical protein HDU68_004563 [Siphonaria sp. JEL0065]